MKRTDPGSICAGTDLTVFTDEIDIISANILYCIDNLLRKCAVY